ncbi:SGNH/GDSL hydrolase family protein [Microbacterium sp. SS28]|uniref:SGNH/GDSL hydrolase family protein n=1 Tax=Microbacterium sp. SS28 TaxID=2919948 RepID=UPI001FA9D7EF|nr:SGNH/GDSL hydrolase family protein [Microbacterium sp. SS28]
MNPHGPSRGRHPGRLLLTSLAAVAIVCAIAVWHAWSAPAEPVRPVAQAESAAIAPAPISLPDEPTVLVFGDSWTYGSAATLPTLGYAYVLGETQGWNTIVDGVRGSGYLKPGIDGGSYGERIAALDPALHPDLVIVEGSINDRRLYPTGFRDAVTAAWDALGALYPDADFVILGPAPQVLPVEKATARIDADLAELATARGWWYVSPIADDWITDANYAAVIDSSDFGRDHPSTEGHAYLAARVAEALDGMTALDAVAADAG